MIFVQDDDYNKVIKDDILDRVIQGSPAYLWDAERASRAEMISYLNPRFDTMTIFSQTGDARDALIVMYFVDIVLYHIHSRINPKQVPEIRVERYERAIAWLKAVSRGEIVPALPTIPTEDGQQANNAIAYGSKTKRCNDY
jgi:phage gp36-like protein